MLSIIESHLGVLLGFAAGFFLLSTLLLLHAISLRISEQQRNQLLKQLEVLRKLLSGLQRHRGLSNGLLSGDTSLRQDLEATRQQLDALIRQAQALATSHEEAWNNLFDHWSRLRQGSGLQKENNLIQHHLIIRNSIFLLQDLATSQPLTSARHKSVFISCIWQEVIQAAEWAGQARALGTGIAAARKSNAEQRIRLRFLYQKIHELSGEAFHTLQQSRLDGRFKLTACQQAVEQLLTCIDQELLNKETPDITARIYFQQATQAIDQLFSLVDASLETLKSKG
ncbi:nitrate- and nitrite sensing domain-containing protein [Marinospirillum sp.]|uniref:nitrate- and nitrite sensing domain-containing protein n=1 Tax=Marinospirillum sp. TaxID=2183934 RepID=UPI0028703957|nr:nitrate- and nitrite sensing domain-containing protein [Marinospirillum sp.]MDR9468030.1 nitrate- and nitrite sensing domain-containing protein [Marinospirillum sp.]